MPINPTYKQLETKLRISGLTIGQWVQLFASGLGALLFALYLSPLPVGPTLTVSVLLAGFPVALAYGLSGTDFSVTHLVATVWRWARRPSRYQAGAGSTLTGYFVDAPPPMPEPDNGHDGSRQLDLEALWER